MFIEEVADLRGALMWTSVTGAIPAILAFSSNISEDWSLIKVLLSITSAFVGFYLFLLLIGLGEPSYVGFSIIHRSGNCNLGLQVLYRP